ncbi:arsenate reductase (glutaredoxin) [Rhizorhapis suberifaciens]|uniref:Arsenate reductase n=1 Tax=Rhizorhapis suberifaciens TaxID=13656 RepID=A0A840HSK0_9SPHN|nr:arsenate reductase (glutaredoxin) [Rhizorhapis suberifaciens]MBB4640691.1 arsenate reductase [Rhizorhapis suberifaciens]
MKATIWHNPSCGTSRKTLAILEETPGVELEVVEYLKTPPSREKLAALYKAAGITPRDGLRTRQEEAKPLLTLEGDAILDAMVANPILIERPLVETEKGVRLCRPQDKVRDIL